MTLQFPSEKEIIFYYRRYFWSHEGKLEFEEDEKRAINAVAKAFATLKMEKEKASEILATTVTSITKKSPFTELISMAMQVKLHAPLIDCGNGVKIPPEEKWTLV